MSSVTLDQYEPLIGKSAIARIRQKAEPLRGKKLLDINSALTGGGVAELLVTQTALLQDLGIKAERQVITGSPEFFAASKHIHNALQSDPAPLADAEWRTYQATVAQEASGVPAGFDLVTVHDPQPLPLIGHLTKTQPWVWRCHVDLSDPNRQVWDALALFVERYDAMVVSLEAYRQAISVPQSVIMPAIDPFSPKNAMMTEPEIDAQLEQYDIPTDKPLVVQVSRFDKWKDPAGVVEAFRGIQDQTDAVLVLLGNFVIDDPDSEQAFQKLRSADQVIVLAAGDDLELVSALQWRAAVVVQKSIREAFGLTVSEAMWRAKPVVGGNTDGIRAQISNGQNGFIVDSPHDAGKRILELLRDGTLRERLGRAAKQTVTEKFLFPRLIEQQLDLYAELLK